MGSRLLSSGSAVLFVAVVATSCGDDQRAAPAEEQVGTVTSAVVIPGLRVTGVNTFGNPLAEGALDPNYRVTRNTEIPPTPLGPAVLSVRLGIPNGASSWISVRRSGDGPGRATYVYTTTFTLSGVDPRTAQITGAWACDDDCSISLNGTSIVTNTSGPPRFNAAAPFTIPAGSPFRLGSNTLDFQVINSQGSNTGLHVTQIAGSADQLSTGTACSDATACASGFCVNSVCCNSACQGPCVACSTAAGAPVNGTCSPRSGGSCNDGSACTSNDTCQNGTCAGANTVTCTASDACHDVGVCDAATGRCSNPAKPEGTECTGTNACSQRATCRSGVCTGGTPTACTASDACHVAGVCNSATGTCSNPAAPNGTLCNDANRCTASDTCQSGICQGAGPVTCQAIDQCHDAGVCDPATGLCSNPEKRNGSACNDRNACTASDTCQDGACVGANAVVCVARGQCHLAGVCNPSTGVCSDVVAPVGSPCSDGNDCTQRDTCEGGTCIGSSPVVCLALDACHDIGTCNPANGVCSAPAKIDGTPCNDGNACTQSDSCRAGVCAPGLALVCPTDQCHAAPACDPLTGGCSAAPLRDGTPCDDGNACTQTDVCTAGACGGTETICPVEACLFPGVCNPATGACSKVPLNDGTPCDDENECTTDDSCESGVCGGDAVVCPEPDQCHNQGLCDPTTGKCSNAYADGTRCDDGNPCTRVDGCVAGACTGADAIVCAASDQCHSAGTCDPTTGACDDPPLDGTPCNDENACTQLDLCERGACVGRLPVTCAAPPDLCHGAGVCAPDGGVCAYPLLVDSDSCQKDVRGGGCGCEVVGRERSGNAAWLGVMLALGTMVRRRRSREGGGNRCGDQQP